MCWREQLCNSLSISLLQEIKKSYKKLISRAQQDQIIISSISLSLKKDIKVTKKSSSIPQEEQSPVSLILSLNPSMIFNQDSQ